MAEEGGGFPPKFRLLDPLGMRCGVYFDPTIPILKLLLLNTGSLPFPGLLNTNKMGNIGVGGGGGLYPRCPYLGLWDILCLCICLCLLRDVSVLLLH